MGVQRAEQEDALGALGEVEEQIFRQTKKLKVIGNVHSAARAPLLFANGAKVGAAQAATNALRCEATYPVYKTVDDILKKGCRAGPVDYIGVKQLVHRTNPQAGESIEGSGKMRPGHEGVLGAGIYFGEDEEALRRKARSGGGAHAIVNAHVDLGHCRIVHTGEREWRMICDGGFDKEALYELGFHSVGSCFNGGWEYCVFDPDRINIISVQQHRI